MVDHPTMSIYNYVINREAALKRTEDNDANDMGDEYISWCIASNVGRSLTSG